MPRTHDAGPCFREMPGIRILVKMRAVVRGNAQDLDRANGAEQATRAQTGLRPDALIVR